MIKISKSCSRILFASWDPKRAKTLRHAIAWTICFFSPHFMCVCVCMCVCVSVCYDCRSVQFFSRENRINFFPCQAKKKSKVFQQVLSPTPSHPLPAGGKLTATKSNIEMPHPPDFDTKCPPQILTQNAHPRLEKNGNPHISFKKISLASLAFARLPYTARGFYF